jgi:drug/metabolite transporter (DMT)-like permease
MSTGVFVVLGILANCIWGAAFLIPYILPEVNPTLIALGRYLVYGALSMAFIIVAPKRFQNLSKQQWLIAFSVGFAGNLGYYLLLSGSIYYSGITIAALIIGILPVSLAVIGNLIEKTYSFRSLALSALLILSGMLTLGLSGTESRLGNDQILPGTALAVLALMLWTYYGIKNAQFLKSHPNISSNSWSLAIGACCLLQSLIALLALAMFTNVLQFATKMDGKQLWEVFWGCFFLGIVVSWLATVFWNQASRHMPVALGGQLIVFETISSLAYGYVADQRLPSMGELLAVVFIIIGVITGLRATQSGKLHPTQSSNITTNDTKVKYE